jgi:tRNA(Phe) wybutosine-synthesizing methylase Tyw3
MINFKKICDINNSDEGKILIAAIGILTSINRDDVDKYWGGMIHPDDALERVVDLANKIFYQEEWQLEQIKEKIKEKREDSINKILD